MLGEKTTNIPYLLMSTPKEKLRDVPHKPGIYIMKDRLGGIIYIGKARDLRKRLSNYFTPSRRTTADVKTRALIDAICDFDIQLVRNEHEALLLEGKLIKKYRPRYNVVFRDDKRFLLVKIDLNSPFPRPVLTRIKKDDGARYFGPFVHSGAARATLEWLTRSHGLRTCRARIPGEKDYLHCHADVIRKCSAPCVGKISPEDYLSRVQDVCELLEGKGKRKRLQELRDEMQKAAESMAFERAAKLRDIIENLEKTLTPSRQFSRKININSTVTPEADLAELGEALKLERPPHIMECFDISNISNTHIVASMVRFRNGKPDNQSYRRYRIKTVAGQDDFASMAEVVRRRYGRILLENHNANPEVEESQEPPLEQLRRLAKEGKSPIIIPDLVIVDGGKGQLSSAHKELQKLGLSKLPLVGLAKQHEEIFFPNRTTPLLLDHDTGALKLMQRIRDEAHRFANSYNELLLRKRVRESILDEAPGISAKRKKLLLEKFGSVARLRETDPTEIAKLPGLSLNTAENLLSYLRKST